MQRIWMQKQDGAFFVDLEENKVFLEKV
jgi:hypothetical protein